MEYEGLHAVCFNCGIYGHRMDTCSSPKPQALVQSNNGEMEVEQEMGEGVKEARSAIGVDGAGNPHPKKLVIDVEGMGDGTDEVPRGSNSAIEMNQDIFGPWMLSKKYSRKRNTGSTPNHDGDWSAAKRKMGQGGKGGSRFGVLNVGKVGPDDVGDRDKVVVSYEGSGLVVGPECVSFDHEMSPVHDAVTKARNSTGGKNTPLGSRVRDSKKAARTNGSIKKALKPTLGSLGNKGKDNIRPEVTSLAKESINKGDVFNSV